MVDEKRDNPTVQRGITEALACQDMLERAPVKPSWFEQAVIRAIAIARSIARRESTLARQGSATTPHATQ